MAIEWHNVTRKLGDLRPWSENPRYSTKKQARALLKSWDELGQFQTIAISPTDDVYDGHQRLSALLTVHGAGYEIDPGYVAVALERWSVATGKTPELL